MPASNDTMARGDEDLLLVEDESFLRLVIAKTLRNLGYRVFEANNGDEALNAWREHSQTIKVLIADVVLPNSITGIELARLLKKEKRDLKIILSSGYDSEISKCDDLAAEGMKFLSKPFLINDLCLAIRACLGQPESAP
jgi:CheY-like chemotaxis protein